MIRCIGIRKETKDSTQQRVPLSPEQVGRLVREHGLRVLVDSRVHDLANGSVVTQVDHLHTRELEYAPHDIDRCVMAVKEAGRRDETHVMGRLVRTRHLRSRSELCCHWSGRDEGACFRS